jgi:glycosyltransferase involved in cell wall biosynthesis
MVKKSQPKLLSILLPVLNDDRVFNTINRLNSILSASETDFEIIVAGIMRHRIDTGSKVTFVSSTGKKGDNIKDGLQSCHGQYVLIMDADLPVTEEGLLDLIAFAGKAEVIVGYRIYSGVHCSSFSYALRYSRTYIFRGLAQHLLPELSGIDPQFGIKLVKRELALKYASLTKPACNLAFDLEFMLRITLDGIIPKALPLLYSHDPNSVINPRRAAAELITCLPRLLKLRNAYQN